MRRTPAMCQVNAGSFQTISGYPDGHPVHGERAGLPSAPDGYTFGTPTFSPSATVTIAVKDATVEVTTNNTLTRDTGKITVVKEFVGAPEGSKVTLQIKSGATVVAVGLRRRRRLDLEGRRNRRRTASTRQARRVTSTWTSTTRRSSARTVRRRSPRMRTVLTRASRSPRATTSPARSRTPARPARSRSRRPCRRPRTAPT